MKKAFSLVEMIISVGLITIIFVTFLILKNNNTTHADPYEELRSEIVNATNLYLNMNVGVDEKNELYNNGLLSINSNVLISEGLLNNEYFVANIGEVKNIENIVINLALDEEGIINYSINID